MRSADGKRLYLADEDHRVVRVLPLPFGPEPAKSPAPAATKPSAPSASALASASASTKPALPKKPPPGSVPKRPPPPKAQSAQQTMPGAPAQVLPLDGLVLVTIRDPGLLLILEELPDDRLKEKARIEIAADAWGVAVTKDEKTAVVTSAWTHTVTGIDLVAREVRWTLNVAREPRGVVIHPDGETAYVSHLTSGDLTRIDDVASTSAKASDVAFPAAPSRTPLAHPVEGSLGYALVMDEPGHRLLAARHALGALADRSWFGIPTIDVLQTRDDKPLLAPRTPNKRIKSTPAFAETRQLNLKHFPDEPMGYRNRQFTSPELPQPEIVQPRAMIVARKSKSLWVASEGNDLVAEFPLYSAAPAERPLRIIGVGRHYRDAQIIGNGYSDNDGIPSECGAPTGLALNADETLLYVFCRSTYDIATIRLSSIETTVSYLRMKETPAVTVARVAEDPVDEAVSRGRRLFYGARDGFSSGGMGCAGCHPDGRDDGHVWHEVFENEEYERGVFLATEMLADKTKEGRLGYARQTPMLAGRVASSGPYGWHAQNETLRARLAEGFERHRWRFGEVDSKKWMVGVRANALGPFLRKGLVLPPRKAGPLTEQEQRGKEVFESDASQCVRCHVPANEFTDRMPYPLKADPPAGFEKEANRNFRTPSLLFVGGTPPYFHDGRALTLGALIARNGDKMGKTSHLSSAARAALVAYLERL